MTSPEQLAPPVTQPDFTRLTCEQAQCRQGRAKQHAPGQRPVGLMDGATNDANTAQRAGMEIERLRITRHIGQMPPAVTVMPQMSLAVDGIRNPQRQWNTPQQSVDSS